MAAEKFIDIEKIIRSKNPKLLTWMPGFVLRYLKRILHEEEINQFLEVHRDKKNVEFCQEVVNYFNIQVEVEHLERIPKDGKIVLAMNHPLGGMDAMILITALHGHRNDLKFIVNDILMNLNNISDYFIGVNKHGKNKASTREQIDTLFQSSHAVCIFPAGLVSRKMNGQIRDLDWKKTFVTYSKQYNRTIVPIHIEGRLSNFFYRLHKIRKFLRIKANIEMLYLANELFKQRNAQIKFTVGEALERAFLMNESDDQQLAQQIKEHIYTLSTKKKYEANYSRD